MNKHMKQTIKLGCSLPLIQVLLLLTFFKTIPAIIHLFNIKGQSNV